MTPTPTPASVAERAEQYARTFTQHGVPPSIEVQLILDLARAAAALERDRSEQRERLRNFHAKLRKDADGGTAAVDDVLNLVEEISGYADEPEPEPARPQPEQASECHAGQRPVDPAPVERDEWDEQASQLLQELAAVGIENNPYIDPHDGSIQRNALKIIAAALRAAYQRGVDDGTKDMKWDKVFSEHVARALGVEMPSGFSAKQIADEIGRLKRGDFTPEEFQNLCHHRDERPGCTRDEFEAGCREYQEKLFGLAAGRDEQGKSPTWPYVLAFAREMERKLAMNRHKGDADGWRKDGPLPLWYRIIDEADELRLAIDARERRDASVVLGEAADVANFAMMVADSFAHLAAALKEKST